MASTLSGTFTIAVVPFWRRLRSATTSRASWIAILAFVLMRFVFRLAFLTLALAAAIWLLVAAVVAYVVFLAVFMVVSQRRNPPPVIDFDRREMRIGTDTTRFDEITDAIAPTEPNGAARQLQLIIGAPHHRQAYLVLRSKKLPALNADDRQLVVHMLEQSSIRLPEAKPDPYDPTGRFAWMDHPFSRTKEQAIALLREAPGGVSPAPSTTR